MNLESSNFTSTKSSKAIFWLSWIFWITSFAWLLFGYFSLYPASQKNSDIVSPLIIALITLGISYCFISHYHALKSDYLSCKQALEEAIHILEDYPSIKIEDLDLIKNKFKRLTLPIIYDIWREFEKTLVKDQTTGEVKNTHQIEKFFNESNLIL